MHYIDRKHTIKKNWGFNILRIAEKESWKQCIFFYQNIKQHVFFLKIDNSKKCTKAIYYNISEGSWDTEYFQLYHHKKNYIWKYI